MFFKKKTGNKVYERDFFALGTRCHVQVFGDRNKETNEKMDMLMDSMESMVQDFDDRFSAFKEESEISEINRSSGESAVRVSGDIYFLVKKAIEYGVLSEGGLDITIGALSRRWKQSLHYGELPKEEELQRLRKLVDYQKILTIDSKTSVLLEEKGMELDLGCIAKGYCADLIHDFFEKNLIDRGLINLGGNIVAFGKPENGSDWRMGIQHPRKNRGEMLGYLDMEEGSVVTSGTYEQYFEVEGKRYHHIIDPRTGAPFETEIDSVTILSQTSVDGDGLSTSVYMLGLRKGLALLRKRRDAEGIFVMKDGSVYITEGLKGRFTLTDLNYRLAEDENTWPIAL